MSRVFTPDDFVAYVTGMPELDAFARFLAGSKSRSNFTMWTTFTQLCGGYYAGARRTCSGGTRAYQPDRLQAVGKLLAACSWIGARWWSRFSERCSPKPLENRLAQEPIGGLSCGVHFRLNNLVSTANSGGGSRASDPFLEARRAGLACRIVPPASEPVRASAFQPRRAPGGRRPGNAKVLRRRRAGSRRRMDRGNLGRDMWRQHGAPPRKGCGKYWFTTGG